MTALGAKLKHSEWTFLKAQYRVMAEEGVSVLILRRPLTCSVKGKSWRVVVVFFDVTCWTILITCLIVSRKIGWECLRLLL